MLQIVLSNYSVAAKWLNDNQGVAGVGVFLLTLFLGWVSGIFSALRRKPKFRMSLIEGPTFSCTFPTGAKRDEAPVHRTGVALYLSVANIGSAASSIANISIAYHWHVRPLSFVWLRYRIGWFWLHDQATVIHDFQAKIGENTKFYPFLTQRSILSNADSTTFLEPGRSTNGVVYFEQSDSWGGCFPSPGKSGVRIKIALRDVFGRMHTNRFKIQAVTLEEARKYNPSFGKTCAELRNETLPHDASI
ncbi:hypothetical protein LP414_33985 [Polaromonas sp. P1(28)-13]|nr:hypothetical protein LP414_33985 [Polaromonas sp. P1(28)-13]